MRALATRVAYTFGRLTIHILRPQCVEVVTPLLIPDDPGAFAPRVVRTGNRPGPRDGASEPEQVPAELSDEP